MKTNWKRAQRACAYFLLSLLVSGFIGCGNKKSAARKRQESAKAAIAKGVPKNADAQLDLAYKFYLGKEVTLNYAKAAELFKIAAAEWFTSHLPPSLKSAFKRWFIQEPTVM